MQSRKLQTGKFNIRSMQTPRIITTKLLEYTEIISKWVDDESPVDVIYLYFQKAFDKVPHQRLLIKLKSHGMGVNIVTWIQIWLTDRMQRVSVEGEHQHGLQYTAGCLRDRYWGHYSSSFI